MKQRIILYSNFDFILKQISYCNFSNQFIKVDVNPIQKINPMLKGGWWLVVVKFWESKLTIHIEDCTMMDEIYGRAAKWICIIPRVISLSGRLYPGGPKVKNISPNTVARGGGSAITYLKMKVNDTFLYDIRIVHDAVDA
jgi:hypothetical protein